MGKLLNGPTRNAAYRPQTTLAVCFGILGNDDVDSEVLGLTDFQETPVDWNESQVLSAEPHGASPGFDTDVHVPCRVTPRSSYEETPQYSTTNGEDGAVISISSELLDIMKEAISDQQHLSKMQGRVNELQTSLGWSKRAINAIDETLDDPDVTDQEKEDARDGRPAEEVNKAKAEAKLQVLLPLLEDKKSCQNTVVRILFEGLGQMLREKGLWNDEEAHDESYAAPTWTYDDDAEPDNTSETAEELEVEGPNPYWAALEEYAEARDEVEAAQDAVDFRPFDTSQEVERGEEYGEGYDEVGEHKVDHEKRSNRTERDLNFVLQLREATQRVTQAEAVYYEKRAKYLALRDGFSEGQSSKFSDQPEDGYTESMNIVRYEDPIATARHRMKIERWIMSVDSDGNDNIVVEEVEEDAWIVRPVPVGSRGSNASRLEPLERRRKRKRIDAWAKLCEEFKDTADGAAKRRVSTDDRVSIVHGYFESTLE